MSSVSSTPNATNADAKMVSLTPVKNDMLLQPENRVRDPEFEPALDRFGQQQRYDKDLLADFAKSVLIHDPAARIQESRHKYDYWKERENPSGSYLDDRLCVPVPASYRAECDRGLDVTMEIEWRLHVESPPPNLSLWNGYVPSNYVKVLQRDQPARRVNYVIDPQGGWTIMADVEKLSESGRGLKHLDVDAMLRTYIKACDDSADREIKFQLMIAHRAIHGDEPSNELPEESDSEPDILESMEQSRERNTLKFTERLKVARERQDKQERECLTREQREQIWRAERLRGLHPHCYAADGTDIHEATYALKEKEIEAALISTTELWPASLIENRRSRKRPHSPESDFDPQSDCDSETRSESKSSKSLGSQESEIDSQIESESDEDPKSHGEGIEADDTASDADVDPVDDCSSPASESDSDATSARSSRASPSKKQKQSAAVVSAKRPKHSSKRRRKSKSKRLDKPTISDDTATHLLTIKPRKDPNKQRSVLKGCYPGLKGNGKGCCISSHNQDPDSRWLEKEANCAEFRKFVKACGTKVSHAQIGKKPTDLNSCVSTALWKAYQTYVEENPNRAKLTKSVLLKCAAIDFCQSDVKNSPVFHGLTLTVQS